MESLHASPHIPTSGAGGTVKLGHQEACGAAADWANTPRPPPQPGYSPTDLPGEEAPAKLCSGVSGTWRQSLPLQQVAELQKQLTGGASTPFREQWEHAQSLPPRILVKFMEVTGV